MSEEEAKPGINSSETPLDLLETRIRNERLNDLRNLLQNPNQIDQLALELARRERSLLDRINKLYRDHLNPEVLNNQAFTERLRYCTLEAIKSGGMLVVALADLDNFKQANDTFGHDAGDEILAMAGDALNQAGRRRTDTVENAEIESLKESLTVAPNVPTTIRKGGDEFAALWPGTEFAGALLVAARAQTIFSQMQAEAYKNLPQKPCVGMTLGIAVLDASIDYPEAVNLKDENLDRLVSKIARDLVINADDALYVAKKTQKGSIVEFNPDDPRIIARRQARGQ